MPKKDFPNGTGGTKVDMSASTQEKTGEQVTGYYVYGIVPSDVEVDPGTEGIGDPPREVKIVKHGDVAALVSEIDAQTTLGRPGDLFAHEKLLDATAIAVPVLPVRFGAVLTSRDAVTDELLAPFEQQFAAALAQLEGRVEYVAHGRYDERVVLAEVLSENPEAGELRARASATPEAASRDLRVRLGEIINQAIERKREEDGDRLVEKLDPLSVANVARPPTHEFDAASVAFLVEDSQRADFEQAVADLAGSWQTRIKLRLLGPLAPYDFAESPEQAESSEQEAA
jgi:hypothetical protein